MCNGLCYDLFLLQSAGASQCCLFTRSPCLLQRPTRMGITGLIPFLDKATEKTNLSRLPRGSTAAVDTYCWLHKGAFACADLLARGDKTDM